MDDWTTDGSEESSDRPPRRSAFYPDEDVQPLFEEHIRGGWIEPTYEVIVRRIGGDERVRFLLLDGESALEDIHRDIRAGLGVANDEDALEPYFWLFWRGWSGRLDAETARRLPLGQDLMARILAGVQLRGDDLEALATGLGWFHAMNAVDWGDTGSWDLGTLSTPHSKSRRVVREYVLGRMAELYGDDYADL